MPGFEFPGHTSVINDLYETGFADGGSDRCGEAHVYGNLKPGFVLDTTSSRAVAQAKAIMEHFMPWFSGPYVHIGGEEVSGRLAACPRVSAHISATSGITSLGDMLTVFFNDLNALVRGTGRSMIIYNGVEGLNPNISVAPLDSTVVVMDWNARSYSYYGGRPGSAPTRHKFIKMRQADGHYLTPNNSHHLYPDEPKLYDRWNVEPVSTYLGAAVGVWLGYLSGLEGIPGFNTLTAFNTGQTYWIAVAEPAPATVCGRNPIGSPTARRIKPRSATEEFARPHKSTVHPSQGSRTRLA